MEQERLFFKPLEDKDSLLSTRKEAFKKGYPTGFKCLDEISSFLPNYSTVVYSPPHVGKSVITLDILMAQAEMGRNVCIYSPEFRDKKELINALIQARLKKCFFGKFADSITDEMYLEALAFVNEHFVLIVKPKRKKDNSQEKMSIKKIFHEVKKASDYYKMKFDFLFIDPFNYIEKDADEKFMEMQDYVLNANDQFAEYSQALGLHTIISAHTRDIDLISDKETGILYYPVGHPSWIMGGQSWFRSSFQILHYWRAPEGVLDNLGREYPANYNKIFVQKAKPFGIGKLSDTSSTAGMDGLFFDPDTYTMYEIVDGKPYYRNEYYNKESQKKTNDSGAIKPNLDFGKDITTETIF